jgi:uncharacterized protein YhdP
MQGDLQVDLNFQMNLNDRKAPPQVDVQTRWQQVDVDIRPGDIPLRDINGSFSYQSSRGFSTTDMGGTLWGRPFSVEVLHPGRGTDAIYDPASTATQLRAVTSVDFADLRRWLKVESLAFASGVTAAEVRLDVVPGQAPLLRVDSTLEGASLDLPSPWRKAGEEVRLLQLSVELGGQGGPLEMALGDDLSLHMALRDGGLQGAALGIGEPAAALEAGSLLVTGHTPLVQGDEWGQFISTYFAAGWVAAPEPETPDPNAPVEGQPDRGLAIVIDDLQADLLEIWGQSIPEVAFSLLVEGGRWHLSVATDWLEGEYRQTPGEEPGSLVLQRLDLLGARHLELAPGEGARGHVEVPAMNVAIERLHRGDLELGNLSFQLASEGPTLTASDVAGAVAGIELGLPERGQLTWQQEEPSLTSLQLGVGFKDLGETLARLGYERIVETRGGNFRFDLKWPGAPQAFSLAEGEGAVAVAIKQGRFLEAPSGASGALKVVNILNLADIVQRLSLSHMFESGIPFDSVEGEVFLHGGTIEVAGMEVKGPSSFFFSGVADVERRSLNGELVATLPVADNLPWVAALAAGLPVAAGVYVVSKLLQKQVDQLSSAVYSISGSWDDPQVEFAHIFDSGDTREDVSQAQLGSAPGNSDNAAEPSESSQVVGEPKTDQPEP